MKKSKNKIMRKLLAIAILFGALTITAQDKKDEPKEDVQR